ncbi:MAG TPA: hypothetical protein VN285_07005 [Candidatus Deferrimicrobium sp.]|nr:hypothetical protein [Candidatus Deferrimicrobium sp.]
MRITFFLAAAVLMCASFVIGNDILIIDEDLTNTFKILVPGVFDRSVARDIHRREWYGLFKTDSGCVLEPVEIKTKSCPAPFSDRPGDTSWVSITIENRLEPLLLVSSSNRFESGLIPTYFTGDRFIQVGILIHLEEYYLTALGLVTDAGWRHPSDIPTFNYQAVLLRNPFSRNDRQILIQHEIAAGESTPSLLWAGDLDRDGRLDLLLNISNHYASTHYALYLSSEADAGGLVKPVAQLIIPGC